MATSYARDIRPLFRRKDRESMAAIFDLWVYQDVKRASQVILDRVAAGVMPCDGPWPPEKVQKLRRWIADGMQP
jgi:hypothetical protein